MKSTLFTRGKTRRAPPAPASASGNKNIIKNETPVSVDESDIYFDTTPRVTQSSSPTDNDDGSRPPPSNPEAISVASSTFGGSSSRSGRNNNVPSQNNMRPGTSATTSTRVPPKINVNTFWAANEEFERKYDLTPVHRDGEDGAEVVECGTATFSVDPWEHDGSSRRGTSSGR